MRVLDFLYSEEAFIRARFGEKGGSWDYCEDGAQALYKDIGVEPHGLWITTAY